MPSYALTRRTLLGAALASTATFSFAQVEKPSIKFSQGWLFQATQASFSVAEKNGYYKAEGLTVDIDRGAGSSASVQRVVSGTHDLAYADVGTIVKWNAELSGAGAAIVMRDGRRCMFAIGRKHRDGDASAGSTVLAMSRRHEPSP